MHGSDLRTLHVLSNVVKGCSPLARGFGAVRFKSSGVAPRLGCFHRGQKRAVPFVSAHRLQEHEEVLAEVQVEQRGAIEGSHHAGSRGNGPTGCQRGPISSQEETGAPRFGCQKLRVSERKNYLIHRRHSTLTRPQPENIFLPNWAGERNVYSARPWTFQIPRSLGFEAPIAPWSFFKHPSVHTKHLFAGCTQRWIF